MRYSTEHGCHLFQSPYGVPVSVTPSDVGMDPAGLVLTTTEFDASVLQPAASVTLDANGQGTLLVKAVEGTADRSLRSKIALTDARGDLGWASFAPDVPLVGATGGPVVGNGATAPSSPPAFTFVLPDPSLTPVTVAYSLAGSTADPDLYGGRGGSVTIPANTQLFDQLVTFDYNYQKVSAQQAIVVTLDRPGNAGTDGPGQRATMGITDDAPPTITFDGKTDNADVTEIDPVDTSPVPRDADQQAADDAGLVPVAMHYTYWGDRVYTELTWDPTQDLIWPTKHVGVAGKDDLASRHEAGVDCAAGQYRWAGGDLPAVVWSQPIGGSTDWDATSFGLMASVALAATAAVPATTGQADKDASGTQHGPTLTYDGKDVANGSAGDVLIGQDINVTAGWTGPLPKITHNNGVFSYKWTVDSKAIADYQPSTPPLIQELTSNLLSSQTVTFFWKNDGRKSVTCAVDYDYQEYDVHCSFNSVKPTTVITTAATPTGIGILQTPNGQTYGLITGLQDTISVTTPAKFPVGSWGILQTLTGFDRIQGGGTWYHNAENSKYELDGTFPQSSAFFSVVTPTGIIPATTDTFPTNGTTVIYTDTPYADLNAPYNVKVKSKTILGNPSYTNTTTLTDQLIRRASLSTYIMFKPAGTGHWVPLKLIPWSYAYDVGVVGRNADGSFRWGFNSQTTPPANPAIQDLPWFTLGWTTNWSESFIQD